MRQTTTGFHAVEEKVRSAAELAKTDGMTVHYAKAGPRVKRIIEAARAAGIAVVQEDEKSLDALVAHLPDGVRDHRGIVLTVDGADGSTRTNEIDFDGWLNAQKRSVGRATVLILDSITDPHNVGAILRSCDQFGASLVVLPARRGAGRLSESETVARASAGAAEYVPVSVVPNLVRAARKLKDAGFWVYGADAGGERVHGVSFPAKTAIVMGSEGSGISKLLMEQCDSVVSIPTCGNIDSLNVSVAAGVLLYERFRQTAAD